MGANLGPLLEPKTIRMEELKGAVVAIDAFNMLYQFITTIRQADGSYLSDSKGRVTSHLTGLFSRTTNFLQKGIKPIFVFDGEPPTLKMAERQRRRALKDKAEEKYEEAKQSEDVESMKKFAGRTAKLTGEMIRESKEVLRALGVPTVDAPSEGEAQVAELVRQGLAQYGVSQDYDSLLHGNPRVVRNLSLAGRRKRMGAIGYKTITPEIIELPEVLNSLGVDQKGLIALATLIGTDYNIGGVRGIGPKKALALVKKHTGDYEAMFEEVDWPEGFADWREIMKTIEKMPVIEKPEISWDAPDRERVYKIMVEEHDFSPERVNGGLDRIKESVGARAQKGLGEFF